MTDGRPLRMPRDHIVQELAGEHAGLLAAVDGVIILAARAHSGCDPWTLLHDLRALVQRLGAAESLYELEEQVLFARLELRGLIETTHPLRLDHEAIRLEVRALRELAAGTVDPRTFRRELRRIRNALVPLVRDHVRREERDLLPLALEVIGEDAWPVMRLECLTIRDRAAAGREELSA